MALQYLLQTATIAAYVATLVERREQLLNWIGAFIPALSYLSFWAPTLRECSTSSAWFSLVFRPLSRSGRTFSISPPARRLATMTLSISEDIVKKCPGADGIVYEIEVDGARLTSGALWRGNWFKITLPKQGEQLSLANDKAQNPTCDHVIATLAF